MRADQKKAEEDYQLVFTSAAEMHSVGQRASDVFSLRLSALLFHIVNAMGRGTKGIEAISAAAVTVAETYQEVIVDSAKQALEGELNGGNN